MPWILRTFLTISLVALPLFLYVGLRLAGSIGILRPAAKRRARTTALLVIVWIYVLPLLVLLFYGFGSLDRLFVFDRSISWADYLFQYPFWIMLIVALELTSIFLLLDVALLVARLFRASKPRVQKILGYTRLILGVLMMLYVPVRVAVDTAVVKDTAIHLPLGALPQELDGIVLSVVADVQVDRYTGDSKISQVRRIVDARNPDLLLSAGDMVTSGTAYLDVAAAAIRDIKGTLGSLAVMGDHDFWSAPEAIRAMYLNDGWIFLDNEHHLFTLRGRRILVTGLTHIYSNRLSAAALRQFLNSAPKADLRILLVHQPAEQVVRLAAEEGYTLVIAGHTHGGQIVLHPFGIPWAPSLMETRFYDGVYTIGSTTVVVTRGVGETLAPVRYHSGAEVTTLVLTKPSPESLRVPVDNSLGFVIRKSYLKALQTSSIP
jgi:predicted MPP superfamily phosphohydrolase